MTEEEFIAIAKRDRAWRTSARLVVSRAGERAMKTNEDLGPVNASRAAYDRMLLIDELAGWRAGKAGSRGCRRCCTRARTVDVTIRADDAAMPGEPICTTTCPCCLARLDIEHGDDEGQVSVIGTPNHDTTIRPNHPRQDHDGDGPCLACQPEECLP